MRVGRIQHRQFLSRRITALSLPAHRAAPIHFTLRERTLTILREIAGIKADALPDEAAEHFLLSGLIKRLGLSTQVVEHASWKISPGIPGYNAIIYNQRRQMIWETLRYHPRPAVAALFADLEIFHIGNILLFEKAREQMNELSPVGRRAVQRAVDVWIAQTSGLTEQASAAEKIAAYETFLPKIRVQDLYKAPLGYERSIGIEFKRISREHGWQLGEYLVAVLRHHDDPVLREHYAKVETYHFPNQMTQPWRNRKGVAVERIKCAVAEVCEILEYESGEIFNEGDLCTTPLRYHNVMLPYDIWEVIDGRSRGLPTFLPPHVRNLARLPGVATPKAPVSVVAPPNPQDLTPRENKCLRLLEVALGLNAETPVQDYITKVQASFSQSIAGTLRKAFHEPSPPGGFAALLIATLKKHPRPDLKLHFRHLKKYHLLDCGDWQSAGTIQWAQIKEATFEALQFLALQHLKRWPQPAGALAIDAVDRLITDEEFVAAIKEMIPVWREGHIEKILQPAPLRYGAKLGYGPLHAMEIEQHAISEPVVRVLRDNASAVIAREFPGLQAYNLQGVKWVLHPGLVKALGVEIAKILLHHPTESLAQRLTTLTRDIPTAIEQVAVHTAKWIYFKNRHLHLLVIGVHALLTQPPEGQVPALAVNPLPDSTTDEALTAWLTHLDPDTTGG